MGSMSSDGEGQGGYGEGDSGYSNHGGSDANSTGDLNVDAIMDMNREADLGSIQADGTRTVDPMDGAMPSIVGDDELNIGAENQMFGVDESEMSDMNYGGKTPLPTDSDFDFSKIAKKLGKLGKGFDGGQKSLGESGPVDYIPEKQGANSYRQEPFGRNPYGKPEVPKRGLKTADYESVFADVMGLLQRSRIRKPTISSLV